MQENIDYSSPNDGLGDKLRNAFIKVQNNFTELFNGKVDKIVGKGLSQNDYTDADKSKLDGIESGAQVNVNSDFGENDPDAPGYILNKPPSMYSSVGHFHFSDLVSQTTPLVVLPNVPKKLTNDALGLFTVLDYAPYGVSLEFWNTTNNQFDFSNLSLGDSMLIRVDLKATTTSANQTIKIYIKLGIGTASEYDLLIDSFNIKTITADLHIIKDVSLSIDNDDWNNAPAEIYFLSDDDATVKVNGWYVPIIRKSVNIIDITTGSLLKDPTTYTPATLPLAGTEVAILNDGTNWVKITWNNIKSQLALIFQYKLTAGTNITIDNTNPLAPIINATDTQLYKTISGNVTIDNAYHNCIVSVTANATITIPTGLRSDWNAVFDVVGAFTATFVESGTTFSAPFGKKLLTDKMGSIYTTSTNNFRLNGGFSV